MVIWIAIGVVLLIIELITTSFLSIFFALGALGAAITSLITANLIMQLIVFLIISIIGIVKGKEILQRYFEVNKVVKPSNINALIGKEGIVTKVIESEDFGLVKLGSDIWSAKSLNNIRIDEGEKVIVKDIDGVKLLVTKIY